MISPGYPTEYAGLGNSGDTRLISQGRVSELSIVFLPRNSRYPEITQYPKYSYLREALFFLLGGISGAVSFS